mgnify:CR=1 FL=1
MLQSSWLQAFITFAEHANFTHAAKAMHLSQPALHLQIQRLSEAVGVPLYTRQGRRLQLTEAGTALLAHAREQRDRSAAVVEQLRSGGAVGAVRLSAGSGAYLYLLGPAIRAFRRQSRARLTLYQHDQAETLAALRSASAQLGVATLDGIPSGMQAQRLVRVPQVLVMPRRHPLARKRKIRLADLAHASLILPPEGRPQRAVLSQALMNQDVPHSVSVEATGWHLVLHFVQLGLGLTVVNGCCQLPRGLVARPLSELPTISYYLLSREGAALSAETALLRRMILDHIPAGVAVAAGGSRRGPAKS